jgi:hypothetical protein
MQADFSIELGRDAPALEIPWRSDDSRVRYFDLKIHPELVQQIPEAVAHPELATFLSRINAAGFPLATAKCDTWSSNEVAPEEEIFGDRKFVSYIDLVLVDQEDRCSFEKHEAFAQELCRLLSHAPEIAAAVELVIRHCYYHQAEFVPEQNSKPIDQESLATMRATEISSSRNKDTMSDNLRADITLNDQLEGAKEHDEQGDANDPGEQRDLSDQRKPARETGCLEPCSAAADVKAETIDLDYLARTIQNELAVSKDWQQSISRESQRADLPKDMHLLRMPQSGESADVPPERKPGRKGESDSVTGFCITAYVTGFGDHDHDPLRRWAIALHLLQNAIVQLNRNLQQNY